MKVRLGIIIPARNEAGNIGDTIQALRRFPQTHRILVVDDESEDDTSTIALASGAEVLRLAPGQGGGKGIALRQGIEILKRDTFDYYLFLDGDGQHDPADLQQFLDRLNQEPDLDFIIGSRKEQRHLIPPKRWRTNSLGSWTLSRIAGVRWEDTQCGFRMIRKTILDPIPLGSKGFAIEMEMAMKAAHRKIRWAHVPIRVIYHPGCPSHFRGLKDVIKIMFYSLLC